MHTVLDRINRMFVLIKTIFWWSSYFRSFFKIFRTTVPCCSILDDSHIGCVDDNCVSCKIGYFKYYRPEGGSECLEKCPVGHSTVGTLCVGKFL